jgi:4'-phosphopantetheinyl transferase
MSVVVPDAGAPSLFGGLTLEPARPLRLWYLPQLTVAVVSTAWLRALDDGRRAGLVGRHLDSEEAAQEARLHVPKRRHEWLAGRLAIKHSVAAHQVRGAGPCVQTRQVRVGVVESGIRRGKPLISAPADVSMSHSGDFAIAVCGHGPVGVDLEKERELAPPLAAALRADELTARDGSSGSLADMPLTIRWTCREAVLKCLGVGLRVDWRQVTLTGWEHDGRFGWRAGEVLRQRIPGADPQRFGTWAGRIARYALAVVWAAPSGASP